jgi:acetylglutamate kinase
LHKPEADPNIGIERNVDLGFVGDPVAVNCEILNTLSASGMIPVVAPIAPDESGQTYNINADTMAGAIAAAVGAKRLFLLTDVAGVMDKQGNLLTDLNPANIADLKADGTAKGGMIPKLDTCVQAVEAGVEGAVIIDGRVPHAMLLEIFTAQGAGTLVHR